MPRLGRVQDETTPLQEQPLFLIKTDPSLGCFVLALVIDEGTVQCEKANKDEHEVVGKGAGGAKALTPVNREALLPQSLAT